ncbi:hypothetical protein AB7A55_004939 [Pseudomonas aeruginosa]
MSHLAKLKAIRKKLRQKASCEWKRVGNDSSHYEGTKKGLAIAYDEASNLVDRLIREMEEQP